jgi:hypothetical protein
MTASRLAGAALGAIGVPVPDKQPVTSKLSPSQALHKLSAKVPSYSCTSLTLCIPLKQASVGKECNPHIAVFFNMGIPRHVSLIAGSRVLDVGLARRHLLSSMMGFQRFPQVCFASLDWAREL